MKNIGLFFVTFALSLSAALASDKPNILFIFADDLCYETISAHGYVDIDTPHLDSLVKRGATFTHAYNMGSWSGAVCAASRKMLNTGQFLWDAHKADLKTAVAGKQMWSQQLREAGYRTYYSGKWHVGAKTDDIFDVVKNVRGGMPKQTKEGYNRPKDEEDYKNGWKPWDPKHGGFWEGGKHWSEVLADDGVEFLEAAAKEDNPFFMYLAFNAAHDPRQAPKEYVDRYPLDRIKMPENFIDEYPYADAICGKGLRDEKLVPYPRTEFSIKINRQEYFALITHMDDQIGRLLEALKASGKEDNTYIVFTADHGLAVGHHGLLGKQNMYDHSIRVPFMITGPGIKAGQTVDASIYLQDVMPTSLELAGIPKPDNVAFKSVMPLLSGKEKVSYPTIYGAYLDRQRMIIKDGWKLISYPTVPVERLYKVSDDPHEMKDHAKNPEYANKLKSLRASLAELQASMHDPLLTAAEPNPKKDKKK